MWETINALFSSSQYIPHGHCYLWQSPLVMLHLISDLLIGVAYFSIPAMLVYFVYKRSDVPFLKVFILFSAFIILCGTGHFLDILTLWYPVYWVTGIEHALTAIVSCYTALQLVELLPQFLSLRTREQLEAINQKLETEIAVGEVARQELQQAEETLKRIVAGTAAVTGDAFFSALVENLATVLNVRYAFVAEVTRPGQLKTLAFWSDGQARDNFEYDFDETLCEEAIGGLLVKQARVCYLPVRGQSLLSHASVLQDQETYQYLDVPLLKGEESIGVLGIASDRAFLNEENAKTIITIFAARAAAELQRQQAETALRHTFDELEDRVQERTVKLLQTNQALRENEEKFRTLVSNIPGVVYRRKHDSAWTMEFISEAVIDVTGCPASDLINNQVRTAVSYVCPDDISAIEASVQNALNHRQPYILEYRMMANGAVKWIYEKGQGVFDEEGNVLWLDGTLFDISDRKRTEAALEASQDFLNRTLNAVADPIFVKDDQHRWTMINDAFCQMMGYSRSELLGKSDYDFLPPEQARVFWQNDDYVFKSGVEHETEEMITDGSGVTRTLLTKKIAFADALGQPSIVGIIRDITDRKRIEEARRQVVERERTIARVVQQMRRSLDLETIFSVTTQELQQAIQCDRVLVYRFQPDWSGQLVSEAVAAGWNHLILRQADQPELTQIAVDQANCAVKRLDSVDEVIQDTYLQTTQGGLYRQKKSYRCVSDIYQTDFEPCYLQLLEQFQARAYIVVPIFCGNQLWGLLGAYQNAGPRHWQDAEIQIVSQIGNQLGVAVQQAELFAQTQQQAAELKTAKEAADAANRAKSEFLANMSHELRTPLNAILGFTQLMELSSALSPEHQQYVNIISRSGEHLLTLINDVLEMTRIETGRLELNETSFDLHQLLNDLGEMLHLKAQAKGLPLIVDYAPTVPQYIQADDKKLRQVLINLLSNAVKFTQVGGICLRARLMAEGPGAQARIQFAVEDTGLGIADDEQNKLFAVFEQTRTGLDAAEGTGLGLPISQRFVQLMGGEITVRSEPNQGSIFSFEIPVNLVPAPQPTIRPLSYGQVVGLAANQPQYRILVTDDNAVSRLLLMKLLSCLGLEAREAKNGQEAIALWQTWKPHLIWMDIQMPDMNGYEATRYIKASAEGQATAIIALTASAFEEQRQDILLAGCDDFVRKPFRKEEILEKLALHLGVQYRYEQKEVVVRTEAQLTALSLKVMPNEWINQLYFSAAQGSDALLLRLIAEIPQEHASLSQGLTGLVEDFRFEKIMALAQASEN